PRSSAAISVLNAWAAVHSIQPLALLEVTEANSTNPSVSRFNRAAASNGMNASVITLKEPADWIGITRELKRREEASIGVLPPYRISWRPSIGSPASIGKDPLNSTESSASIRP